MPEQPAGMTAGQVESHPVKVLADLAAKLDEPQSHVPELKVRDLALCEPAAERIEQPVAGRALW